MMPAPVDMYPGTGWDVAPAYIPNDVVIPTLDDVPDGADPLSADGGGDGYSPGNFTKTDLAFLDANNLHWDFFINTNNWAGPIVGDPNADDPDAYAAIIDILTKHNPANHTVYHVHMGADLPPDTTVMPAIPQSCDGASSMDTCDSEMQGVETVINKMSNGGRPHLTRFRPPYGEPYQVMGPGLADVEAVVVKYAVWAGWNILTQDADNGPGAATSTSMSVIQHVTQALGTGPGKGTSWGIILMHGVLPWTAQAIPSLFDPKTGTVKTLGYRVGTVEDAICWKYGKHSWEIVQQLNAGQTRGPN
jgi:peptidoglycan/xylan/chitin deacetylase (PgdA/CDA1 family)